MKSPREALSRFLKSCSQLCITNVNFPTDTALQAHLYMCNTHVSQTANFKLNSQLSRTTAPGNSSSARWEGTLFHRRVASAYSRHQAVGTQNLAEARLQRASVSIMSSFAEGSTFRNSPLILCQRTCQIASSFGVMTRNSQE